VNIKKIISRKAKEYNAKRNQIARNNRESEEVRNISLLNRRVKNSEKMVNLTYRIHRRIKSAEANTRSAAKIYFRFI
jgi:hypothetical protein